jgi:hypothetical protein
MRLEREATVVDGLNGRGDHVYVLCGTVCYGTEGVSRDGNMLTLNRLDSQEYVTMTP